MTPADIKRLVDQWTKAQLDEDEDVRLAGDEAVIDAHAKVQLETHVGSLWRLLKLDTSLAGRHVDEIAETHALALDAKSRAIATQMMLRAHYDLFRALSTRNDRRWRPYIDDDPASPLLAKLALPSAQVQSTPPASVINPDELGQSDVPAVAGMTLFEAAEGYIAEALKEKLFKAGRADEVRSAVKNFVDWLEGDRDIAKVTAKVAGDYRREMTFYPRCGAVKPAYRDLPIKGRIALAQAEGATSITGGTINGNYIDPLRGLFRWLIMTGQVGTNPFADIRVAAQRKANASSRGTPDDFTADQLQALFSSTVFTGSAGERGRRLYQTGTVRTDDWRYWLPFMGLFTGARLNELCGLRLDDFGVREGRDFFHVRDIGDDQSVKSKAGIRVVPVHRELIDMGLMDRVRRLRDEGETRLFPTLTSGSRGYLSDKPSKFFADLIDRMVGKDVNVVFHSLRHTFISAMRRAEVARELRTALVGHDERDSVRAEVHDGYGEEAFNRLVAAMDSVTWNGLDLSTVRLPKLTH